MNQPNIKQPIVSGVIPALITPYNREGGVALDILGALVKRLIADGADGFYVGGSTAECFLLSDRERQEILECVLEAAAGRVPVIAHVGHIATSRAITLARHARNAGATAVSSVPPFYYNFSREEIIGYYAAVAQAAQLPLIPYSIPAFSGVAITADVLADMVKEVPVAGIKYTSYDLFELERIRRRFPEICVLNGHDEVFCNALPTGIDGAIGSTYNLLTPRFQAILSAYRAGDTVRAAQLQHEINKLIDLFIEVGVLPAIKYLLGVSGLPCGDCRPPFNPLTAAQRQRLDAACDAVFATAAETTKLVG